MASSTKIEAKKPRDVAYYRQRFRNRVFSSLVRFISEQSERRQFTQKDVACILDKDPAQISRWLSTPGNITLDTLSDLALAFDAEPEPPEFALFAERRAPNYVHPLMARALRVEVPSSTHTSSSTTEGDEKLFQPSKFTAEATAN